MKITLKNFRCYEDATFDFGEDGIVLLSGPSGAGKTSILSGIYFALFGTGSKVVRYGNTSCSVTLEFDGMTITRTKRPNRLVVNSVHEDDAAQKIIDNKFGDTFKTTGYISQNARDSFILMSPIEKLGFLEKFAFQDINLTQIKKRCKDLISERNETLIRTTSQLEIATLMVSEMVEPVKVKFPIECSKKKQKSVAKNEIIRHKNTITLIKRCKIKIALLQKEVQSLQVYNAKIKSKQESLESITEKLANLSIEKENIDYAGDDKIAEYEEDLSILISQRELILLEDRYSDDKKRLDRMKEDEFNDMSKNIENIESTLWKEYTEDEIKNTITEYKQTIKDLEKLEDEKNNLKRYIVDEVQLNDHIEQLTTNKENLVIKNKLLDKLEIQQEVFKCPACAVQLKFQDDDLHVYETDVVPDELEDIDMVSEDISKLKRKIKSLESSISIKQSRLERYKEVQKSISEIEEQYEELPDLEEIRTDIEYIRSYRSSQQEFYKQVTKFKSLIDNGQYSSTISSFEKSVKQQKKKIDIINEKAQKDNKKHIDEEMLRENITTQKHNKEKLVSIKSDIIKLTGEQTDLGKQLATYKNTHLETYKAIRDIDTMSINISDSLGELSELEKKKVIHEQNVQDIEKYEEYEKVVDTYLSWIDKVDNLKIEEIENRRLYGAAMLLREKILESESIAMLNIISSINMHTHAYLDSFFQDNPISVKLVPFKESKKGKIKPQVNLQIEYKGMEADLTMLSGGELSRVILAFALALGEMFNTPMMLLDECTASLDQELTGTVMEGIKDNFNGKIVILICHQVIEGQFDKVIKIS